jgi:zinc protease
VRKYFESIPSQPAPPKVDISQPAQKEERRQTIEDPLARLPRLDMAYRLPPAPSKDEYALSVLGTVLSGGRSSRFYEQIVREKQLVERVGRGAAEPRPRASSAWWHGRAGQTAWPRSKKAIEEEIERVKSGRSPTGRSRRRGRMPAARSSAASRVPCRARSSSRSTRSSTTIRT